MIPGAAFRRGVAEGAWAALACMGMQIAGGAGRAGDLAGAGPFSWGERRVEGQRGGRFGFGSGLGLTVVACARRPR